MPLDGTKLSTHENLSFGSVPPSGVVKTRNHERVLKLGTYDEHQGTYPRKALGLN